MDEMEMKKLIAELVICTGDALGLVLLAIGPQLDTTKASADLAKLLSANAASGAKAPGLVARTIATRAMAALDAGSALQNRERQ